MLSGHTFFFQLNLSIATLVSLYLNIEQCNIVDNMEQVSDENTEWIETFSFLIKNVNAFYQVY